MLNSNLSTRPLLPPPAARVQNQSGSPPVSDSTLSRISSVAFRQKGATLQDITRELKVSRNTAMRWLTLMRAEGFLSRSSNLNGARGRPRWVYHPTERLRARVVSFESDSVAVLSFAALREACKYLVDGECSVETLRCGVSVCPILHS